MYVPILLIPKRHTDARGWLSETFHERFFREGGVPTGFVQDNQSSSIKAGTLRGLHFQSPPASQGKLVSVLQGRVLDVVVDVRRESPTYAKHVAIELSSESGHQLYVPVGFAHGFVTLVDHTVVMYKVTHYYAPTLEGGIRWDDPQIAVTWPFRNADILTSEKDRRLPFVKDFVSPFEYDGNPMPRDPMQLLLGR